MKWTVVVLVLVSLLLIPVAGIAQEDNQKMVKLASYPIGTKGWEVDYFSGAVDFMALKKAQEGSEYNFVARPMLGLSGGITWYWTDKNSPTNEKIISINFPTIGIRVIDEDIDEWAVSLMLTVGAFNDKFRIGAGYDLTTKVDSEKIFGVFSIGLNALSK